MLTELWFSQEVQIDDRVSGVLQCFNFNKKWSCKSSTGKERNKKKNLSFCASFCHVKHFDTPVCQSNNNIKTPLAHVTEMTMWATPNSFTVTLCMCPCTNTGLKHQTCLWFSKDGIYVEAKLALNTTWWPSMTCQFNCIYITASHNNNHLKLLYIVR